MQHIPDSTARRRGSVVIRVAASISLMVGQAHAGAAEPVSAALYSIQQPAQDLGDALRAISRQTGAAVLFDPAAVRGRTAQPLSGQMSAVQAFRRAVEGSGLVVQVMGDGAMVVRAGVDPGDAPAAAPPASTRQEPAAPGQAQQIVRVEVTGSRLKRIESEGPLPVNVYRAEDIARSGQPSLERFLSSLNEASMGAGEGNYGATGGQGSVQLRGLPLGSTLVLLNGRRLQAVGSSSGNFFNLNLIPLAAVERVEVVPVGSSAVYGGDALAGVVNIILKKSLDGHALDARVGSGRGFEDGSLSFATGQRGEQGSFLLLGSYSKATPLGMSERGFFRDADYRRFGGPDARTQLCSPGTVSSTTAANLPGLNATTAGIPATPGQGLTVGSFAATAGQPRLCSSLAAGNGFGLVHGNETLGLHVVADRQLGAAWTVFGELTHVDDRLASMYQGLTLNNVVVPASNLYNPFGAPVRVSTAFGLENGSTGFTRNTRYSRLLGGLRGDVAPGWELEVTASTSRDDGEQRVVNNNTNVAARTAALASTDPATALNPFSTGRVASDDVLHSIWTDAIRQFEGRKDQVAAFVRGPLAVLPAGPLDAIVGAEVARDVYRTAMLGGSTIQGSRNFQALYGEMRAPLLRRDAAAGRGGEIAALTLAARSDHYSDFGSAGTYQAGLELRPTSEVLLRASAASSFKPPTLSNGNVAEQTVPAALFGLVDPARGKEPITSGDVLRTTNRALQPEHGKAYSLGANWEPEPGVRLGATAWRVRVDGLIGLLWPQSTLDNEGLFPGVVTREPAGGGGPGRITRIVYTETNIGRIESAGVDLEASRSWRSSAGTWTGGASATRVGKYDVRLTPGSPVENRLGRRYADYWAPAWKARVFGGFDARSWSLGLTGRYLGGYQDAGTSARQLGGFMVFDLAGRIDLKKLGVPVGAAKSATLAVGIVNVANRMPQFVETSPFYDPTQADWRGRTANVRLSVDW